MLTKHLFILCLLGVCLFSWTAGSLATSVPSKQDVIDGVIAARESVADIEVAFRFEAIESPEGTLLYDKRTIRVKDDHFFMEREISFGGDTKFRTGCSYDGVSAVGYQGANQMGYVTSSPDIEIIETEGSGFFDLLL